MKMSRGLQLAVRLKEVSVKALAIQIIQIIIDHENNQHLSDEDIFIAGLRYYEFYADGTDDASYTLAIAQQEETLRFLHIDKNELFNAVDQLFADMKNTAR